MQLPFLYTRILALIFLGAFNAVGQSEIFRIESNSNNSHIVSDLSKSGKQICVYNLFENKSISIIDIENNNIVSIKESFIDDQNIIVEIRFITDDLIALYYHRRTNIITNEGIQGFIGFLKFDQNSWSTHSSIIERWFFHSNELRPDLKVNVNSNTFAISQIENNSKFGPYSIEFYNLDNLSYQNDLTFDTNFWYDSNFNFSNNGESLVFSGLSSDRELTSSLAAVIQHYTIVNNTTWELLSEKVYDNYYGTAPISSFTNNDSCIVYSYNGFLEPRNSNEYDKIYKVDLNFQKVDSIILDIGINEFTNQVIPAISSSYESSFSDSGNNFGLVIGDIFSLDTISRILYFRIDDSGINQLYSYPNIYNGVGIAGGGNVRLSSSGRYMLFNDIENNVLLLDMSVPTNIENISSNIIENITIYPNPTTGILYIKTVHYDQISVFNSSGHLILDLNTSDKMIDLTQLPSGQYEILIFEKGTIINSKRIIKL